MEAEAEKGRKKAEKGRKKAEKGRKKRRRINRLKKICDKQQSSNQFANALVKPVLIQLVGENHADELNNIRKE